MENVTSKSQSMERFISWKEIKKEVEFLLDIGLIKAESKVYGVPRGGQYLAAFFNPVDTPQEADIIIDDLVESGATLKRYKQEFPDKKFIALFTKGNDKRWYIFPWELKEEPLKDNILRICQYYKIKPVDSLNELIVEYEKR
jgi:hypothetical protein